MTVIPRQRYSAKKNIVKGLFAGGLVSLVFVLISFISSNPITLSYDAEKRIGAPFIGAIFKRNCIFDNVARCIIGERKIKNDKASCDMIYNFLKSSAFGIGNGSSIAIVCSMNDKYISKTYEVICSIIKGCGYSTVLVSEASQNPDAVVDIQESDAVILLERQWKSKWVQIDSNTKLIDCLNKQIIGFILC